MKMKNDKKDPRFVLSNVADNKRSFHANVLALRFIVEELQRRLMAAFVSQQGIVGTEAYVPQFVGPAMNSLTSGDLADQFAAAKTLLEVVEDSQIFKDASAEIDPLLSEIAAIEAEEERQRQEQLRNEEDLRQAERAAEQEVLAGVKHHPLVIAARRKLGLA